jgi:hypothetical protein
VATVQCDKLTASSLPRHPTPSHDVISYREDVHDSALRRAVAHLHATACGPALEEWTVLLERECIARWAAGRMLCSNTSLLGFLCTEPLVGGEASTATTSLSSSSLPFGTAAEVHPHRQLQHVCRSGVGFTCACVCGKTQVRVCLFACLLVTVVIE